MPHLGTVILPLPGHLRVGVRSRASMPIASSMSTDAAAGPPRPARAGAPPRAAAPARRPTRSIRPRIRRSPSCGLRLEDRTGEGYLGSWRRGDSVASGEIRSETNFYPNPTSYATSATMSSDPDEYIRLDADAAHLDRWFTPHSRTRSQGLRLHPRAGNNYRAPNKYRSLNLYRRLERSKEPVPRTSRRTNSGT